MIVRVGHPCTEEHSCFSYIFNNLHFFPLFSFFHYSLFLFFLCPLFSILLINIHTLLCVCGLTVVYFLVLAEILDTIYMSLVLVLCDKSISFSCSVMKYNGFMHISQDCAQHFNKQFNTIYTLCEFY